VALTLKVRPDDLGDQVGAVGPVFADVLGHVLEDVGGTAVRGEFVASARAAESSFKAVRPDPVAADLQGMVAVMGARQWGPAHGSVASL
jgi:hypothetical protein